MFLFFFFIKYISLKGYLIIYFNARKVIHITFIKKYIGKYV